MNCKEAMGVHGLKDEELWNAAIDEAVKVIMKRQDDADHPVIGICLNLVDGIKELKE